MTVPVKNGKIFLSSGKSCFMESWKFETRSKHDGHLLQCYAVVLYKRKLNVREKK